MQHTVTRFPTARVALFAALCVLTHAHASNDAGFVGAPDAAPLAAYALAQRVLESGDHAGLPFAIIHKRAGMALVYHADGRLAGVSSVLLGATPGDRSAAGVGERTRNGTLRAPDLTTPAGRFASEPGRNLSGEPVVWIDYDSALAIHRLRPGAAKVQRSVRLASAKTDDKRVSAGCVVVPEGFYEQVIEPVLGRGRGVVYVMPEHSSWRDMWHALDNGSR